MRHVANSSRMRCSCVGVESDLVGFGWFSEKYMRVLGGLTLFARQRVVSASSNQVE
jgi:hypothetical protein